ncbi:N5,N10-methylene tetrahydromethanopterin reductase [Actinoplanes sp. SE50]|uniref:TIGR03557 family F420-dependent LLM class oxidoreductase n=1 Tax=unclassified Actinoplanes TaxID=2626549 RepID=UPI00023EBEE4|nr:MULTISPECIES: TIGR03557 family F420-dependent LLM class oxidoreductase [unclassified Actinoplanes]AEV83496.1 putative dehydrogenase [Actinoplanes sp. SE50/110]ATO82361.1 N5,N10-methylene tetrahydromethanopterin reductase [Actinoplanes sp. SE50]SLL99768.1 LLM class F420-dependent oxidoreductase [Actinoplanes sp. SE50/110]
MRIGYKLMAEGFGPQELIRQAIRAEQAGFDFVEMSDHYHPWLEEQGHSPFAWNVLSAIAARTDRLGLATGVTCPTVRYHPAIIAQAAATLALISDGRFTLGIGSGERLNEHVVGRGFPGVAVRQEMLAEALDIINLLWQGGYRSYQGRHLQLEDARVFDLPDELPVIAVAAGGKQAAELAATHGSGLFATEPRADLVTTFQEKGGTGPRYAEIATAWAPTVDAAVAEAHRTSRWSVTGWKVMSELPNPVNFDAASQTVRPEDVQRQFVCGPDPQAYRDAVKTYSEAGFDHLVLMNAGPDPDGFLDFFESELSGRW